VQLYEYLQITRSLDDRKIGINKIYDSSNLREASDYVNAKIILTLFMGAIFRMACIHVAFWVYPAECVERMQMYANY
jgi:hypothetical protein